MSGEADVISSWVKKSNKKKPKLIRHEINGHGKNCYFIAISDSRRKIKLCVVYDGMYTRYGVNTIFAADGIDAVIDSTGNHLAYKFARPYGEVCDDVEPLLWVYENKPEDLPDFDFNCLNDIQF